MKKIFLFLLIGSLANHINAWTPTHGRHVSRTSHHNQHQLTAEQDAALLALGGGVLALSTLSLMEQRPLTHEWHAFTSGVFASGAGLTTYALAKMCTHSESEVASISLLAAAIAGGLYYKCRPGMRLNSALRTSKSCLNRNVGQTSFSDIIFNAAAAADYNNWNEFRSSISTCGDFRSEHLFADSVDELISYHDDLEDAKGTLEQLKPYSNFEASIDTTLQTVEDRLGKLDPIIRIAKTAFPSDFNERARAQEAAAQLEMIYKTQPAGAIQYRLPALSIPLKDVTLHHEKDIHISFNDSFFFPDLA